MDDTARRYAATMQEFRASACALVNQSRRNAGFSSMEGADIVPADSCQATLCPPGPSLPGNGEPALSRAQP